MEANRHISKGAAGGIIALTAVVVFAASAYALHDEPGPYAAAVPTQDSIQSADSTLTDTMGTGTPRDSTSAVVSEDSVVASEGPAAEAAPATIHGRASFYGYRFEGRPTANGETFDPMGLTAAHRTLPFGARVRVTNTSNGRSVIVRINDRGPFMRGRILDVSRGAAERLGMIRSGLAHVKVEVLP